MAKKIVNKRPQIFTKNTYKATFATEIKYYGVNACQRIFQCRPHDIIKAYIEEPLIKKFSSLLFYLAKQKKSYHVVEEEDLNRLCDSTHHEGICLLTKEKPQTNFKEFLNNLSKLDKNTSLVYLDGVQNPHNLGSIVRLCAHFGVPYILGEEGNLPAFSPSCARIAQGACEVVELLPLKTADSDLFALKKAGFSLISTSSHKGDSLYKFAFPPRIILALGGESQGISPRIAKLSDAQILIPGTTEIESLNVSQASAIFLSEYWRQIKQ